MELNSLPPSLSSPFINSAPGTPPTRPGTPNTAYHSPALAYANAQLSQVTAGASLPAHMNHQSSNFSDYSNSAPGSAASSPGTPHRKLPGTPGGTHTPGGNSRVAASSVTGKRLNWSDMICQTIAESPDGRLVIQDLFEGMCAKFPEIREWAFGKDWEARVKNRIKSTLSIKGNLFVKQARPSSAAGKGSWWTLSPEAQEQWKAGRVANVLKTNGVGPIGGASSIGLGLGNAAGAIPNSFGASPSGSRPPSALAQGSAPPQPPIGLNTGGGPARASPAQPQVAFGQQAMPALSQAMPAVSAPAPTAPSVGAGVNVEDANGEGPAAKRMRMMDSSLGDFPSVSQAGPSSTDATPSGSGALYDLPFSVPTTAPLGAPQSLAHLGGPQSMPFPAAASAHSLATAVGQSPFGGAPYLESFHPPFGGALPGGYMPLGISAEGTEAPPQDPGLMGGPSPADSTSVYWAYTPAVQAADRAAAAAAAQQGQSENAASSTKRRRPSEAPTEAGSVRGENETGLQSPASVADLQLPPPEARTETLEGGGAEPVLYKTAGQQGQPPAPANGNGNAPNNGAAQASNPQMAAESAPTSTSFPRRQSVVQGGGASDPNSGAATAPATASNGTAPPASDPTARKE